MLKSYFKAAWRNLARHKMFTAIHVLGLALGISACLAIYLIIRFELSFDNFHPGKENIYRLVSDRQSPDGMDHSGSLPDPAPFAIREEISGFESVAVFYHYDASVTIARNGDRIKKFEKPKPGGQTSDIVIAGPEYFDIFQYDWVVRNDLALKEPNTVVLTESKARLYFGKTSNNDILNKTIIYNDSLQVRVAGIVMDLPRNTDFLFRDFISFSTVKNSFLKKNFNFDDWNGGHTNEQAFVKLHRDANPSDINTQLAAFSSKHLKPRGDDKTIFQLQPLSGLHFDAKYNDTYTRKANLPTLYGLIGIALFILIIAIINFITLSTAQSVDRTKETAIRKICGSSRVSLMVRFMGETFLLTLLAIVLSTVGIQLILQAFGTFIPDGVRFDVLDASTWLFLLGLALVTTILAGIYPAKILSSGTPVLQLKGTGSRRGNRKNYFIQGLIVFQFAISLVFIVASIVAGKQILFMLNKDLGFTKDAVLTISTNEGHSPDKKELLANRIRQLSGINKVSISEGAPIATLHWFNPLNYKEKGTACILEWGDEHFVSLYNIRLIAGRNVMPSDTAREFLINESCAKALGFERPEDAVGELVTTMIPPAGMVSRPIVGVMADFHSQSLHEPVKPVVFTTSKEFTRLINIKLAGNKETGDFKTTVAKMEKLWNEIYPGERFDYTFFDATIARFYEKEQQAKQLMGFAMIISICIACLGLFALSALTSGYRKKEIGIRKVLGAGIGRIVFMLNRDMLKPVCIAILVALPVAWYCMDQWLSAFAFRITISWQILMQGSMIIVLIALGTVSYQSLKTSLANPVSSLKSE